MGLTKRPLIATREMQFAGAAGRVFRPGSQPIRPRTAMKREPCKDLCASRSCLNVASVENNRLAIDRRGIVAYQIGDGIGHLLGLE